MNQTSITTAVAWQFTQSMLSHIILASAHPTLNQLFAHWARGKSKMGEDKKIAVLN